MVGGGNHILRKGSRDFKKRHSAIQGKKTGDTGPAAKLGFPSRPGLFIFGSRSPFLSKG